MELGGDSFGRELGFDEVMTVGPRDEIRALVRRDTRALAVCLCRVRTQPEVCLYKPARELFPETSPAGTLISDLLSLEL